MLAILMCVVLSTPLAKTNGSITNLDDSHTSFSESYVKTYPARTPPQQMPGWPNQMPVPPLFAPAGVALADIDGDGYCEVLTGTTQGAFYVWDYQGNLLTGWPKTGIEAIQTKAAVADIDTSFPGLEIIVPGRLNIVYAWHSDGTNVPGWPQIVGETGGFKSPVVFDIDGDGDLEIIIGQRDYPQGRVRAYHHDGTPCAGWPKTVDYMCVATPSVGDVDNDGVIEICAVSFNSVYLWDKDGNDEPGWPQLNMASGMSYAQPVLCDITGDGMNEIIVAYWTNWYDSVNVYLYDGSSYGGWPKSYPGPQSYVTPVAADIDGDGDYEIFGGGHTSYNCFLARHHTGAPVSGWPVDVHNNECSPIVFDLDDDGDREVIVGENSPEGYLYAFHGNGTMVDDWPIQNTINVYVNSASVADVDADGDIEIALLVADGTVNLWTIEDVSLRNYLVEWGTFFHDNWNTGWVHPLPPQNLNADVNGDTVSLSWDMNGEPDIAGYNVYRSDVLGGPYDKINEEVIAELTYVDIPGTGDYYYCVTAQIYAVTESRLSNEVTASVGVNEGSNYQVSSISVSPNPFQNTVTFASGLNKDMTVTIYDAAGSRVEEIDGQGSVVWHAEKDLSQGVYFAVINAGGQEMVKKVIKLK
ncbi:MAG: VCBS repeat-containing protein [candidate division WOR-3 bacterium]|nr:MAG: VCBS repeat-containing protein [candidate division WOR-3 bacterium]